MNLSYLPIFGEESRFSSKSSLYLYGEHPWDLEQQVRSITAITSTSYSHAPQSPYLSRYHPGLDFFNLNLNNDFSAFHGQTLIEQAEFANDAIRSIRPQYSSTRPFISPDHRTFHG
ncbi:GPI inositol deacylase [Puccinia graminis f. sp. tritici]|uniref:GPI inositol deacylase n=1 Tax=Puccinia graminis f. sp. tritici TaxID=56615 RepID=A0A5B0NZG7_PUCGR|nr:GPI inositol deacylase [Puccinia graminis f. sp. tritici]